MSIGTRLKEERLRLKLNQTAFAELGGVTKKAQINYEQDIFSPNGRYFEAMATAGVDVGYVLTGEYMPSQLTADEQELLRLYKAAPLAVKAAVLRALTAGPMPNAVTQIAQGKFVQQTTGPLTNTGSLIFPSGKNKKKQRES